MSLLEWLLSNWLRRLRPFVLQGGQKMAHLFVHQARIAQGSGDFSAHQFPIPLPQPMHGHSHRAAAHAPFMAQRGVFAFVGLPGQKCVQPLELPLLAVGRRFFAQSDQGLIQHGQRPAPVVSAFR